MVTVAQAIVEFLNLQGIQHVFGAVSPYNAPIIEQLTRTESLKFVSSHREEAAMLMADGYARAHGAFSVALASCTNTSLQALPGLAHAFCDGSPVVVISTEPRARLTREDFFQLYIGSLGFDPEYCSAVVVHSPHTTIQCLSQAFRKTMGARKYPVHVAIPYEFLLQDTAEDPAQPPDATPSESAALDQGLIKQAAEMLAKSEHPLILLGGGAVWSGASNEAMELAEFLFAPIASSNGKSGIVPDDYPLSIGRLGTQTNMVALQTVAESDVIIVLGCRLEGDTLRDISKNAKPEIKIIHIDIDPQQIGKNHSVQLGIVGDVKIVLHEILSCLKNTGLEKWPTRVIHRMQRIWERKAAWNSELSRLSRSTEKPIRCLRLLKDVFDEVGREGVFFGEIEWKHGLQVTHFPLVESFDFPIPGANLPLALGAQLALPDRRVVALMRDGQAMNVLSEISTAVECQIPILIVVAHNAGDASGKDNPIPRSADGLSCNFAAIALAMGAYSERVENPADIRPALRQALASRRPSLLEFVVHSSIDDSAHAHKRTQLSR